MMSEPLQPADGQCAFFLPKKKRFCRFRPNQGQKYCPEHACVLGVALDRKRIVCPLNPKHTCYEDQLDKHLKKCNSRKRRTEEYYEENINAGSEEEDCVTDTQTAVKATNTQRLKQIIEKVNRLYEEHIGSVKEDVRSHQCLHQEMDNPYFGLSALRHRRQQASLIGQLEGLGLLTPGHCYVEMGAGKGQLSHWVRQAVSSHDDAAFLLVDRSSIRYKVDGYHKEEERVKFERIKMDIKHLALGKVPMVASGQRPLVAIGKHLCGAATDLTLRCLMETVSNNTRSSDTPTSEPVPKRPRTNEPTSDPPTNCCAGSSASLALAPPLSDGDRSLATPTNPIKGADDSQAMCSESVACSGQERDDSGVCGRGDSDESVDQRVERNGDVNTEEDGAGDGGCDGGKNPHAQKKERSKNQDSGIEVKDKRVEGVLIALCCHHQCTWSAYVGKHFMRQCGLTASDFHLLTRLTSWAVCGWRDRDGSFGGTKKNSAPTSEEKSKGDDSAGDRQEADHDNADEEREHNTADLVTDTSKEEGLQLTEKQKEEVGWRCKRLIDFGRVRYLQNRGMSTDLKIYIDPQQTPENVVLIATHTASR